MILYAESDQQLLLAARPPSRLQRRVAYGVTTGLLAIFLVTAPYAALPLPHITAFIPVYGTALAFIDLTIAALIFAQFWVVRGTWLLVLGSGFLIYALIAIPYALTFPGAFEPSGLLGAGPQTAAHLSICWHFGSPLVLIIAVLARGWHEPAGVWPRAPGLAIGLSIVLVTAIVCGMTWGFVAANDHILPWVYVYRVPGHDNLALFLPMIALNVIALVLLWLRGPSVLDLWLMVLCSTWIFQISLVGILGGSRYALGWYTGFIFEVATTFAVLVLLLSEQTALYANLARATIQRRGARHARQIAMDVMATSIAHEIKQPLAALLIDAESGLRQLQDGEPDLEEVEATFSDIAADGQRIKDIIGGVRTIFKGSDHDRRRLDVNQVVRDALAAVDLEVRQQDVTVRTELDAGLSPILADGGQLHQVFLNLITNAIEAMAAVPGRPSLLRLSSGMATDSSDLVVTVEDTGVGIPDNDIGRAAEPFFSTKSTGSGVGLTLCKAILKAHGGRLSMSANKPYGIIVRVALPTGDADDDE